MKRDSLPLIVSVMALSGLGEAGELRSAKALMLLQDSGALSVRAAYHGGGADWSEGITLEEIGQSAASLVTGEPPAYVLQVLNDGSGRRVRQTVRNIERRLRVDPAFAAAPIVARLFT